MQLLAEGGALPYGQSIRINGQSKVINEKYEVTAATSKGRPLAAATGSSKGTAEGTAAGSFERGDSVALAKISFDRTGQSDR